MVAGFQPGENQNPLPRAAGRFDHHPPLGWNNPPTPRWNASESASIARRCPHDIRSTKGGDTPAAETALNRLSEDFPTG